jgi:hypothetical protein
MTKAFFGSLDFHSTVLERSFSLMREKKVLIFDKDVIQSLIDEDLDRISALQKRPSLIPTNGKNVLPQLLSLISNLNPFIKANLADIGQELSQVDAGYFKAIGIVFPLPLQIISFNFCKLLGLDSKKLLQLETG